MTNSGVNFFRSPEEHSAALRRVDELMAIDLGPGTPEFNELQALARLVESYEKQRFPIPPEV